MGPAEASEEEEAVAASGLQTSQLLVMKWASVYVTEAGVLMGMLGGDVVEETEVEVVRGFVRDEVKVGIFKFLLG